MKDTNRLAFRIHHSYIGEYEPFVPFEDDGLEIYSTSLVIEKPTTNERSLNFPHSLAPSDLREIIEYGETPSFQFYNCREVDGDNSSAFSPVRETREHVDLASHVEVIRGIAVDNANNKEYPSTIGAVLVASGLVISHRRI